MIKLVDVVLLILCWPALLAAQGVSGASAQQAGSSWNELKGEKLAALQVKGDAARGAEAFKACQGCHKRGAMGTPRNPMNFPSYCQPELSPGGVVLCCASAVASKMTAAQRPAHPRASHTPRTIQRHNCMPPR